MSLLKILCAPVHLLSEQCCKLAKARQPMFRFARRPWYVRVLHSKKTYHCLFGVILMGLAASLYHDPPKFFVHEFWELTAFGIHGLGIAPIVNVFAEVIGMEL